MLSLVLLVCGADPVPAFVVENKVPPFVVVNRVPRAAPAPARTKWVAYTRAPIGHTHECDRCHVVWDHAENPTHTCANCGQLQFIQTPYPKPVTLWRQVPVTAPDREPEPLPASLDHCPPTG